MQITVIDNAWQMRLVIGLSKVHESQSPFKGAYFMEQAGRGVDRGHFRKLGVGF